MKNNKSFSKGIISLATFIYIVLLTLNIVFKNTGPIEFLIEITDPLYIRQTAPINLVPFFYGGDKWFDEFDIITNIVAFIPLGIFTGVSTNGRGFFRTLFTGFAVSFLFEWSQYYFSLGAPDITDIITNTSGAVIGYIFYRLVRLIFREKWGNRLIALISVIGVGFFLFLEVYIFLNN